MTTLTLKAHTNPDGGLDLHMETGLKGQPVDVVVEVSPTDLVEEVDALGWPVGFFETVQGCFKDEPMEEPPDLHPDTERDLLL